MTEKINTVAAWNWVIRYVAMILVVLALAAALGSMDLFAKTTIGKSALSAATIVHFIGYGAALAAFWMLGRHLSSICHLSNGRWVIFQPLILPIVTLVVISASYYLALLVLRSFLSQTIYGVYKWIFIVAMIACSIWLVAAVLGQSNAITEAFVDANRKPRTDNQIRNHN